MNDQRNTGFVLLPKGRLHKLKWYGKRGGELNVHKRLPEFER
jgi:hypothetical protein